MTGPQPNNAPDSLTTGKKLQQAREALQLSTGAIARQLRLKPDIIEAIEADRCDRLPPVYLRGHIKNYAHIVGLDPEELLDAGSEIASTSIDFQPCASVRKSLFSTGTQDYLKFATYLIVGTLGVLTAASWRTQDADTPLPQESAVITNIPAEPAPELALPAAQTKVTPELAVPAETPHVSVEPLAAAITPPEAPVYPVIVTPLEDIARAATEELHRLVFELSGDSWTEVKDAEGVKLYSKLATEGQTIRLGGRAPFSVVLGNAPRVAVFYNGRLLDITPWSRGGVARFKVGGEGAGEPR
ncbi:MAG: RodZ domain-containing protein [Gammaproteobacteria bacterium]